MATTRQGLGRREYVLLLVLLLSFLVVSADVDTHRLIEREKLSSS